MGFVSNIMGAVNQAAEYDNAKNLTLAQGLAERNKAYAQATETRRAAEASAAMAGLQLMQMRGNQRRDEGAARAAQAFSGSTSEGSGNAMVEGVSAKHEQAISNAALAESVKQQQAINEQIVFQRKGDEAYKAAEAEADQYRRAAKATRTGAWISAASGLAMGIVGAVEGATSAQEFNAAQKTEAQGIIDGKIKPGDTQYLSTADALKLMNKEIGINDLRQHSLWQEGLTFGAARSSAFSSAANAMNPYLARFTTPAWQEGLVSSYVRGNRKMRGAPFAHI